MPASSSAFCSNGAWKWLRISTAERPMLSGSVENRRSSRLATSLASSRGPSPKAISTGSPSTSESAGLRLVARSLICRAQLSASLSRVRVLR
jgi:hypothetical protein